MRTTIVVNDIERATLATISVRIDEELVKAARQSAAGEFRTIQAQLEFWAKVGKAALDNPDLPVSFIADSLLGLAEPKNTATPFVPRSRK